MKKKCLLLALAVVMALALAACGGETTEQTGETGTETSGETIKVGFSQMSNDTAFKIAETESVREEVEKRGWELVFTDAQWKMDKQVSDIEDLITQGVDYILLAPNDYEGYETALASAKEAGIPVILLDREANGTPGEDFVTCITSDFIWEGEACGKWLQERNHSTCETCNTYNMLKLSRHLYEWTGDPKYLDFYEKALYNHILASQHPETGMTCYFVPLAMGTRKDFCDKYNSFTCCMGSGFENHSKYGGAIYSHGSDDRSLFVNLYIPSVLTWKEKGLKVRLETAYPENGRVTLKVVEGERQPMALNLRYPVWAGEGIVVKVNGTKQKVTSKPGSFITLERKWKAGDRIELNIPMNLYTKEMPDNADRRAVFYGPTLLAGALGEKEIEPIRGVPVFVSPDKQVCKYIHPVNGKPLTFETEGLGYPKEVTLIPFYNTYDQYYTVYWDVFSPGEWKQKQAEYEAERLRIEELNKVTVDYIVLGEMQPERDHNLSAGESRIGDFRGKKYRYAYPTGFFDFDMKVSGTEPMKMMMTFWGGDCGRDTFEILIDGERLELFSPKGEDGNFVENTIVIPAKFTEGKDKIRVSFKGYEGKRVTSLYNCRMMR